LPTFSSEFHIDASWLSIARNSSSSVFLSRFGKATTGQKVAAAAEEPEFRRFSWLFSRWQPEYGFFVGSPFFG